MTSPFDPGLYGDGEDYRPGPTRSCLPWLLAAATLAATAMWALAGRPAL